MIQVVFFDVGETLIHDGQAIAGAIDALKAVGRLTTIAGESLQTALVSNYFAPTPPATEAKIRALEEQYRTAVLKPAGLLELFEPFDSRVTISSRAGVAKPAKGIFATALSRLHAAGGLEGCLFVTEEAEHLLKAKEYGMLPVRFGAPLQEMRSFSDWLDAPMLIADLVAPDDMHNLASSAVPALAARHGITSFQPTTKEGNVLHGTATQLLQLNDPRLGDLSGVYVERPTEATVEILPQGLLGAVHVEPADPEEIADTTNFVHTLILGGKIARAEQSAGTTHSLENDALGRRRLVRKRYSR